MNTNEHERTTISELTKYHKISIFSEHKKKENKILDCVHAYKWLKGYNMGKYECITEIKMVIF